ncbi:MAG: Hsp20/alpha crystallin family protein [Pseudomonadota bacterium]
MNRDKRQEWMWERACDALERADKLQRRFFAPVPSTLPVPTWEPPVDIFEDENRLAIYVALPGVDPDSVKVHADPDALVVTARRRIPAHVRVRHMEIPHGQFSRRIALPLGRFLLDSSRLENGCLEISLYRIARNRTY